MVRHIDVAGGPYHIATGPYSESLYGPEGAFQEIEDHYRAIVGWDAWESFWDTWGLWGDVHPGEFRGQDRRLD
ncbi:hypothetical protein EBZ39_03140, partial [bacterium]|nr:hypothetical protein [bacterium]